MGVKTIGFMHSGSFYHEADLKDPALRAYDMRDLYLCDTKPDDILSCDSLVLAGRLHPAKFEPFKDVVLEFINTPGKKAYIEGENRVGDWLPGTREEARPTNFWAWRTGEDTTRRNRNEEHHMWGYYTDQALHWHFHGALFPPSGATPLVVLDEGGDVDGAIIYYDDATFAGEIVVTTMDPCYHHGAGFMPGATQLLYRSLRWLAD